MLVGIVSDTHDQIERLEAVVLELKERGADLLFHCGDLCGPEAVRACRSLKTYFVQGNNDREISAIQKAIAEIHGIFLGQSGEVEVDGKRLAITHGSDPREVKECLKGMPHFLLVGHSHKAVRYREKSTWVINPGALYRAPTWTFALLDTKTNKVKFLSVSKP